ncbi:MAG TPA: nickel pincer cofactor biosynthesis protein LarB [Candidatus Krumholzibacteria bacterium]|nr:nickel pincer cofactor biosynthesis protein LarB [Candidatus Krumholzibacteria bacterium]
MHEADLRQLLDAVRDGSISTAEAVTRLRDLPFADLGVARVDHHRQLRLGFPEVILCEGKTAEEVATIAAHMAERGCGVLGTRCTPEVAAVVQQRLPRARFNARGRTFSIDAAKPRRLRGRVAVVTAGTSDMHVAEEAVETLRATGVETETVYDVGVAGLHRLLASRETLDECDILIVIAGMEGALASVVAGVTGKPTIAVPTSVGYGASFGGIAALLGMLNSCAVGVTVVNIDNGFGAAAAAALLLGKLRGEEAP